MKEEEKEQFKASKEQIKRTVVGGGGLFFVNFQSFFQLVFCFLHRPKYRKLKGVFISLLRCFSVG
jgi:hypothetical protein